MSNIKVFNSKTILFVSNVPFLFDTQLYTLINFLKDAGWDVHIACSHKPSVQGITYHPVEIKRDISFAKDITAFVKLFFLMKNNNFSIIHSFHSKAGLLSSIAAKLARKSIRVHTFTGQVWVTLTGFKKILVKYSDKIIGYLSSGCYCDSFSQKDFLVTEGVVQVEKLSVIACGSLSGIDLNRFNRGRFENHELSKLRDRLGFSPNDFILLFVGRVTRDKGIKELIDAFIILKAHHENLKLLIIGPNEGDAQSLLAAYKKEELVDISFEDYSRDPEKFMAIANLFVLPSYREGFGTVIIEANAMGLTSVGTDIPGLRDAIVDRSTGLLVPAQNVEALVIAICELFENEVLRRQLADQALVRVQDFSSVKINLAMAEEYTWLLEKIVQRSAQ